MTTLLKSWRNFKKNIKKNSDEKINRSIEHGEKEDTGIDGRLLKVKGIKKIRVGNKMRQ